MVNACINAYHKICFDIIKSVQYYNIRSRITKREFEKHENEGIKMWSEEIFKHLEEK